MQGHEQIRRERIRQKRKEGFSAVNDLQYKKDELLYAAYTYLSLGIYGPNSSTALWPWDRRWLKVKDRKANLVRAGALIAAELDRMERTRTDV